MAPNATPEAIGNTKYHSHKEKMAPNPTPNTIGATAWRVGLVAPEVSAVGAGVSVSLFSGLGGVNTEADPKRSIGRSTWSTW